MSLGTKKIGLVVYSQTGNTFSVVEKLKSKLEAKGHMAEIKRLQIIGEAKPGRKIFDFSEIPDLEPYDALIFASPVHAFSLAPMMTSYFSHVDTLQCKPVSLFVTHQFPFAWLGGNRALAQLRTICATKGGIIGETGVISWSNKGREKEIEALVERIVG